MKTICYTILFLLFSAQSYSQKIHFTDPGNFWKVREVYIFGSNTPEDFYFDFWYTTDTVISSITYKRIICSDSLSRGYVREDTNMGIVYYYDLAGGFEDTLYNFNLKIGDSINYISTGSSIIDSITFIDSAQINGIYHKIFHAVCNNCNQYQFGRYYTIIEGVGSFSGPLYPLSSGACAINPNVWDYEIVCFSQNNVVPSFHASMFSCGSAFTFTNAGTCFPTEIQNTTISNNPIIISPNPAKNNINVGNIKDGDNVRVEVLNILGQKLYAETLLKGQNKLSINIEQWNCGIYFFSAQK